jgi:small subunit ribosomal protein S6
MKKYEAIIILNPNLSSKADNFIKGFENLLKENSFNIKKYEDIGRRQLSYSINNHNKGHYIIFNLEGDPAKLIDVENKIKYDESIIRHLFISVKNHEDDDSQLLIDSKNSKNYEVDDTNESVNKSQNEVVNDSTDDNQKEDSNLENVDEDKDNE